MIQKIRKLVIKIVDLNNRVRFIKIHGGQYQQAGLPDLMILVNRQHFWLELKRDPSDIPTEIQSYNCERLAIQGFITGFVFAKDKDLWYTSNWRKNTMYNPMPFDVFFADSIR